MKNFIATAAFCAGLGIAALTALTAVSPMTSADPLAFTRMEASGSQAAGYKLKIPGAPGGTGASAFHFDPGYTPAFGGDTVCPAGNPLACVTNSIKGVPLPSSLVKGVGGVPTPAVPNVDFAPVTVNSLMTTAQIKAAIASAVASGVTQIDFAPGVYAPDPASATAAGDGFNAFYPVANLTNDLTIDGHGAELQVQTQDQPYSNLMEFVNASVNTKLTLRNFKITFKYPPYAVMTAFSLTQCVNNAGGVATFSPNNGYTPAWATVDRINLLSGNGIFSKTVFNGASPAPVGGTSGGNYAVNFTGATQCAWLAALSQGQAYELFSKQNGMDSGPGTRTFEFYHVYDLTLDNVRLFNGAGQGFVVLGAHNVSLVNGTGCYKKAGESLSSSYGCFADIYTSGVLSWDNLTHMRGCGDDCLFAVPYAGKVTSASTTTNIVNVDSAPNFTAGDTMQFVDPSGTLQGTGKLQSISGNALQMALAVPAAIAAGWSVYDQSQAPALVKGNGGTFGDGPNRGIYVDGTVIDINSPFVSNVGSCGILSQYGGEFNLGIVSTNISIKNAYLKNVNYASTACPAAILVAGFAQTNASGGTKTAPPGQIRSVSVIGTTVDGAGTGAVQIASALYGTIAKTVANDWYTLQAAAPYMNTLFYDGVTSCGGSAAEITFCGVNNAAFDTPMSAAMPTNASLLSPMVGVTNVTNSQAQPLNFASSGALTAGQATYIGLGRVSTSETDVSQTVAAPTRLSKLYVFSNIDIGVGQTLKVTVRNAASDSPLTCTLSGAGGSSDFCVDKGSDAAAIATGSAWDVSAVASAGMVNGVVVKIGMMQASP